MPLIVLSLIVQVAFIMHILRTGRNTTWIWIVLMLPGAGAIAYFLMEVLPDLQNSRAARQASNKLKTVVNPNRDIRAASRNLEIADTIENSKRLAEECFNKGLYSDAKDLYQKCLQGLYADDPDLMFGLARSHFELQNYTETITELEKLRALNPEYRNPDAHLIYARALEGAGQLPAAILEYEVLDEYFPGPNASYFYAMCLKSQDRMLEANQLFEKIIKQADLGGRPYQAMHKEFIKRARSELR